MSKINTKLTLREEFLKVQMIEYCKVNNINPYNLMTKIIHSDASDFKLDLAIELSTSVHGAAHILGVSERTIYRYNIKKKKLINKK